MSALQEIQVPDIGDFDSVDVVEVLVAVGDAVTADQSLIVLESDKASMDVPSPAAGVVREVRVSAGGSVKQGDVIVVLEASAENASAAPASAPSAPAPASPAPQAAPEAPEASEETAPTGPVSSGSEPSQPSRVNRAEPADQAAEEIDEKAFADAYASPAVRRFARELGADLGRVKGSGRGGRILKEDVQGWIKDRLGALASGTVGSGGGAGIPPMPEIDFSKFGPIERQSLSKIQKLTGVNLGRAWLHVPLVTQFDEADITELEAFRKAQGPAAEKRGVKLTLLPFLMKAAVVALKAQPKFNSSLAPGGEELILKGYFHLGVAVDTAQGLVVPVIRNVDQKSIYELAAELGDVSSRARERKLRPDDLQGASFTISSLGGIGGTAFTPLVNAPEVAILGVSRAAMKPVWDGSQFLPRKVMPFSLSYDHRVIDGAAGVRFTGYLSQLLTDIRQLLL